MISGKEVGEGKIERAFLSGAENQIAHNNKSRFHSIEVEASNVGLIKLRIY
jgi:hypothetical protein